MNTRHAASRIFEMPDEYPDLPAIKRLIDPVTAAARFMVRSLLADPAIMEVAASPAGVVIIQVPDPGWLEPIADQWRMLARSGVDPVRGDAGGVVGRGGWVCFQRSGAERINPAKNGDALVEHALCMGAAVAGFSPVPDQALPPALLQVADLQVAVQPITPGIMRQVLRALTKRKWDGPIDAELVGRLTPSILRLARRPGQDAPDYLARLASIVQRGRNESRPGPRLEDLAGMDAAVAWGKRVIKDMHCYRAGSLQWADMDRGLLLHGAPGTGKTLFAEAFARSSGLPLVSASFALWQSTGEGYLGDCLKAMRKSFDEARQLAPCVLFIDELDALGDRARADGRNREYWVSVVTCFLELLDGLGGREGVLVIGATNNPKALDPAIVRSGRMDRVIEVALPSRDALERILRHHLRGELACDDLLGVARLAVGASGADCARWVRSARQRARHGSRPMTLADLRHEIGGEPLPGDLEERVSLHEAGHAVAATILNPGKLTQARIGGGSGPAGAVLFRMDKRSTREALREQLVELLTGRAAEEVVLGDVSGGSGGSPASDIAVATCLAAAVEFSLGLGSNGPLWLGTPTPDNVAAMLLRRPAMAAAVKLHLDAAYGRAVELVRAERAAVIAVAARLRSDRSLTGTEVAEIVLAHRRHGGRA